MPFALPAFSVSEQCQVCSVARGKALVSLGDPLLSQYTLRLSWVGRAVGGGRGRVRKLSSFLVEVLVPFPVVSREQPEPSRSPPETTLEPAGPELDVEATADEEAATLAEPGPQPCLHISISGSGLEMDPGPAKSDPQAELMPFDSDSDDESSPSPSGTLQSQASQSTISSSFGSECGWELRGQWVRRHQWRQTLESVH